MPELKKTTVSKAVTLLLLLTGFTVLVQGGGFWIALDRPQTTSAQDSTVLRVRLQGCHHPAAAVVQASAEGVIDGQRKSIPVTLKRSGDEVRIEQQWPSEGKWLLALTATYRGYTRSVLVEMGANGPVAQSIQGKDNPLALRSSDRAWTRDDMDEALRRLTARQAALE